MQLCGRGILTSAVSTLVLISLYTYFSCIKKMCTILQICQVVVPALWSSSSDCSAYHAKTSYEFDAKVVGDDRGAI